MTVRATGAANGRHKIPNGSSSLLAAGLGQTKSIALNTMKGRFWRQIRRLGRTVYDATPGTGDA
jgi:hypothetical protein